MVPFYVCYFVVVQLEHQLKLERSARQDLEMHTGALEQQKSVLQEEVASLQRSLEEGAWHSSGWWHARNVFSLQ